ncbi:MAG: ATP-binding protein [Candidatus Pacebacteria bacterium]|nr:ATP-binding protein [Candidatus Paceibacterota bacterium]
MTQEKLTLIDFTLQNFGIFYEPVTLSLASRKLEGRTFAVGEEDVLRYALVFGENASGKSTLVRGLLALQTCVRWSVERRDVVGTTLTHSRFHVEGATEPVTLALTFGIGDTIYEYGFSYDHVSKAFVREYLHEDGASDTPIVHFELNGSDLVLSEALEDKRDIYTNKKRPDALFLTTASLFAPTKEDLLNKVYEQVRDGILILNTKRDHIFPEMAERVVSDGSFRKRLLEYLHVADFSITNLAKEEVSARDLPKQLVEMIARSGQPIPESMSTLNAAHQLFAGGRAQGFVDLNIGDESEGTQQFLNILAKYVDALEFGRVVVLDEFDVNLHPRLTKFIVQLFQDKNPNNAQLIATTHDVTLLNMDGLTKYNVYFTQKTHVGSAELYSLADFKDVRNDKRFADDYLAGVFGAVPNVRMPDVQYTDEYEQKGE